MPPIKRTAYPTPKSSKKARLTIDSKPHYKKSQYKSKRKRSSSKKNAVRNADPSGKGALTGYFSLSKKPIKKYKQLLKGQKPRKWIEYGSGNTEFPQSHQTVTEVTSILTTEWVEYVNKFIGQDIVSVTPATNAFTQNLCFKYTKQTCLFTNGSELPIEIIVYDVDPKQSWFGKSDAYTIPNMFYYGLANEAIMNVEQVASYDWNISPFLPEAVRKAYKVLNTTKVVLTPGETYRYVSMRRHNKIMDWNKFDQNTLNRYIKGLSHPIIVRAQGTTVTVGRVNIAPPEEPPKYEGAINAVGVGSGALYYVTQTEICMSNAQNQPYQTQLNLKGVRLPTGYVDQFINPSTGKTDRDDPIVADSGNQFA